MNEVSIHEKSCEYRMIRCIYLHCNQTVMCIGMDEHLKEHHKDAIIKTYSEDDSISLSKGYFGGKILFIFVQSWSWKTMYVPNSYVSKSPMPNLYTWPFDPQNSLE